MAVLKVGSKAQVFHGTALQTSGGLKQDDLMKTDNGRIVSKKQHAAGKKAIHRLRNAGYVAKKGEFKLFSKKSATKRHMKTRAMTKANHQKRHNAAVRAWTTRRAHAKKSSPAKVGGANMNMNIMSTNMSMRKNSRRNERKNSRRND